MAMFRRGRTRVVRKGVAEEATEEVVAGPSPVSVVGFGEFVNSPMDHLLYSMFAPRLRRAGFTVAKPRAVHVDAVISGELSRVPVREPVPHGRPGEPGSTTTDQPEGRRFERFTCSLYARTWGGALLAQAHGMSEPTETTS